MRISGFTFLRNAVTNGYPFVESIKSVLPLVDEFICVIGQSTDDTRQRVEQINDRKIQIINSHWNENMRDRGFVYGQQKMIGQYNCSGDWAFYLEGDEVLHEDDYDEIYQSMASNLNISTVEALYFDFLHFYGTPFQTGIAGYRQAPRIIRNTLRTIAPDGLFWVVLEKNKKGRYPKAKAANGRIFHYGHCRNISKMRAKVEQIGKYWNRQHSDFVNYGKIDLAEIRSFIGSHPAVARNWIEDEAEQTFAQDPQFRPNYRNYRNRIRFWLEDKFHLDISKKHFIRLD